jgi:hypothetical protein
MKTASAQSLLNIDFSYFLPDRSGNKGPSNEIIRAYEFVLRYYFEKIKLTDVTTN